MPQIPLPHDHGQSIEKELRGYKSGSVEYFLDTFVNSFALTLDDLSK